MNLFGKKEQSPAGGCYFLCTVWELELVTIFELEQCSSGSGGGAGCAAAGLRKFESCIVLHKMQNPEVIETSGFSLFINAFRLFLCAFLALKLWRSYRN